MSGSNVAPEQVSDTALIRQWLQTATEVIEEMTKDFYHSGFRRGVHEGMSIKLRLLREITGSITEPSADISIKPLYKCQKCGGEFDVRLHLSFGGSHYGGQGFVCPKCHSGNYIVIEPEQ